MRNFFMLLANIHLIFRITPAVLANLPQFDSGLAVKALTSAPMACVIAGIIVMIGTGCFIFAFYDTKRIQKKTFQFLRYLSIHLHI